MTKINRRGALGVGLAALLTPAAMQSARAQSAPTTALLKAVVTIGTQTFEYREENGRDLGDFVSTIGGFTQRCVRVDVSGSALSVFFRPDRNSDRVEVVFELGRLFNSTPANLGSYTVAISRGSQLLTTVNVPAHYWLSRWRWQSTPRPVVADVAALIQQGLLPPYDRSGVAPPATLPTNYFQLPSGEWIDLNIVDQFKTGNFNAASSLVISASAINSILNATAISTGTVSVTPQVYAIMGLAGITAYMPQTGERSEIGIVTEPQAQYICTASQAALDVVRAQAEAAGSFPWHMRDEATSAPINFGTYPRAQWYDPGTNIGTPYIARASNTPYTVDAAHQPALAYVPYLLTGDPYHLETLQFQSTWNWGSLPPNYRPSVPQSRQFAWTMRTLAQTTKMTPASVPSWMLPKSYWQQQLDAWRGYFELNFVNSTRPERVRFRCATDIDTTRDEGATAPGGTWIDPWQDEFVANIVGWIVAMGFTEWRTTFDWVIGGTIARTSSLGGWVRAQSTPYRMILRTSKTAPIADTYATAWGYSNTIGGLTYTDPNSWVGSDMTYLMYTRGSLVWATKLGAPGLNDNLSWATNQLVTKKWKTDYKWRLGTGL